ncbi:Signal transduction histidine kinase [Granulicatella balaenopterae]|uniref:Signal transduction histidine-protein kinase ArlS n=1 Tax=Granulicatella balaenopterae TaxID=137733 RepID=A0A1H9PLT5_9LACT|nr:HAMP domain-containing sensor histidine kinase [Granulicatella balaenopterae]SER49138.1 Signal transduction histidine kinase [Granulicatella balaenopterae]
MKHLKKHKEKVVYRSVVNKWWLIIVATIFTLLSVSLYILVVGVIRQEQNNKIEQNKQYTQAVIEVLAEGDQVLTPEIVVNSLEKAYTYRPKNNVYSQIIAADAMISSDVDLQVYNTSKERLFQTQNWYYPTRLEADFFNDYVQLERGKFEIQSGGPVFSKDDRVLLGYVYITNRLTHFQKMKSQVYYTFFKLLLIIFIITIIIGRILAKRMFIPIRNIQTVISTINDENISIKRLEVPNTNDELALVAIRFNELLDKITFYIDQQKQFVEDVSHELRTPVAIVEGHLSLLNRWGKDDPVILEESLASSLAELQRMKNLVQEMLDLSRAPEISEQYKDSETNVYEAVQTVVNNFIVLYEDFEFIFDTDLPYELVCPIYLNHFEQILIILMDNAVKYSLDRKEIIVSLSRNTNDVEINIQDFGMGMSEENRKKVFSRFYRVDKARSRERGGNGLGLSIAKELVESYGGSIEVNSVLNSGSVFRIKLPVKRELKDIEIIKQY